MLKWAVNGARQSYLPSIGENSSCTADGLMTTKKNISARRSMSSIGGSSTTTPSPNQRKMRRKSSDMRYNLRSGSCCHHNNNKENCLTSTPLAATVTALRRSSHSPHLGKLGSLKDLSNIPCEISPLRSQKDETIRANSSAVLTPPPPHPQYASTLPTFDVEYSPCALVPGPILALRGIGIADTYFEKPRYLSHDFKESNRKEVKFNLRQQQSAAATPSTTTTTTRKWENCKTLHDEDSSLSSSRMGDMTLERMIDAILESARKERKIPKLLKHTAPRRPPIVMSPTYTPADDPASDLNEFWDARTEKYLQQSNNNFNEREVRSPIAPAAAATATAVGPKYTNDDADAEISFHLRRQRAVRRKRKFSEMKNSVLEPMAGRVTKIVVDDEEASNGKRRCNISPDSGRNSFSELEDSTLDGGGSGSGSLTIVAATSNCSTKRRLSFSINDDLGDI